MGGNLGCSGHHWLWHGAAGLTDYVIVNVDDVVNLFSLNVLMVSHNVGIIGLLPPFVITDCWRH